MQIDLSAGYSGRKRNWYYFSFLIGVYRFPGAVQFHFIWRTKLWNIEKRLTA